MLDGAMLITDSDHAEDGVGYLVNATEEEVRECAKAAIGNMCGLPGAFSKRGIAFRKIDVRKPNIFLGY